MPRFRNSDNRASSHVCHRIVMPTRSAAPARRVAPPHGPASPEPADAGGGPAPGEREQAATGRFARARVEKELVERAVARIRATAGMRPGSDGAYQGQIKILERRLEKLVILLGVRDGELERFKREELDEPGLASCFDTVQGLASDSPMVEVKRDLMKRIFEHNVALQASIRSGRTP